MLYEITRSDGSKSTMRLLDPATTIEAEIAKWHPDEHGTVTGWREIQEATARPPAPPPELDLTGVPDVVRDTIMQMGAAMVAMQADRDRDRAELQAAHLRLAALETTNEAVRATLKI
jgi:hypothetical protein